MSSWIGDGFQIQAGVSASAESQVKFLLALTRVHVARIASLELELKSRDLHAKVEQHELDKKLRALELAERELYKARKHLQPAKGGFFAWVKSLRPSFGRRKLSRSLSDSAEPYPYRSNNFPS